MPKSLPLLLAVVTLFLTAPAWHDSRIENFFLGFLIVLALGFGGSLIAGHVKWWKWFGIVGFFSFLPLLGRLTGLDLEVAEPLQRISTTFLGLLTLYVLQRFALFSRDEDLFDRILAAVCSYLVLALVWGQMYEFILYFDPKAMTDGGKAVVEGDPAILYHSLVTITTLGYGDVLPVNPYARLLAGLEAAVGTIYLAVIVASLVAEARQPNDVMVDVDIEK